MRKNIFEMVHSSKDYLEEIIKIRELFSSELFCIETNYNGFNNSNWVSIEDWVDEYHFANWKARGTCINVGEFYKKANIDHFFSECGENTDALLICLEYYMNFIALIDSDICSSEDYAQKNFYILKENCKMILDDFNHEFKYFPEEEIGLVLEKNASATAVAEILSPSHAQNVLRYNHYLLKGDISQKKNIILEFASMLESRRVDLKNQNKELETNLFFCLNNLNVRHDNITPQGTNYKQAVADMSEEELESWYDEIYQLELLSFLLLDYNEKSGEIKELKAKIKGEST